MTVLTASPVIITTAYPADATAPAASPDRHDVAAVATVTPTRTPTRTPSRRSQPAPTDPALTEQLLRQRDRLTADHPDRAKLRAQVIEANLPMARNLARRYAGRGESLDDLTQVAALALIKAIDRFDTSRQVPFASYAIPTILGVLKRHFRDTAWAIRVPRRTQELTFEIATATVELSHQLCRTPTPTDLAHHLHVPAADVATAIAAAQSYHLKSLNTSRATGDNADKVELIDLIGDTDPRYARVDNHLLLRPLFAALPLRERRILTMRFFGDMSQAQIAAKIGMSQMHVSRLLTQSLTRLRAEMQR
jgi:RNA polymerase sigma-B factor